ncbi:MAG TPA: PEP-CTERM sorting domain-containing protein [Verrucomicrobiae bacterium]|nr:PEP-CTERM sorting domain-containing protein [Verrucomicrobiae bacterium]
MKKSIQWCKASLGAMLLLAAAASPAATLTVDPGASWLGYMNVFNLPSDGGAFQFGSSWGTSDLRASFSGDTLTLAPNTIGDLAAYWYIGGGAPGAPGNKIMEANFYQETTGPLSGQMVTFTGTVLANSLTTSHTAVAFIKDFAPDYSSSVTTTVPLTPGMFSVSLATINDPARHVQFGFQMTGVNVWATDVGPFGSVQIAPIPEPTVLSLVAVGLTGLLLRKRFEV